MSKSIKVGDKVLVTRVNGIDLDAPHIATVEETDERYSALRTISIEHPILGEKVLFADDPEEDLWTPLGEHEVESLGSYWIAGKHEPEDEDISLDASSYDEEETLQHRQTHAYYDDEALSPTYSEAVKAGMTFADYTGVNITKDSLGFVSKVDEAISSITAESLDFKEESEDVVNHPSHYGNGRFETIEMIEEITKGYDDGFVAHCVGTAVKYESRAPFKHDTPLEDLRKARKYLEFAIEHLERMEDK